MKLRLFGLLPVVAVFALFAYPAGASADPPPGTIVVGTSCSLPNAIASANNGDAEGGCTSGLASGTNTIEVPGGTYNLSGQLLISSNIDIVGAGARSTAIVGSTGNRVFEISSGSATIDGVTIQGGNETTGGGSPQAGVGGGIFVDSGASLTLQDSTVSGNEADTSGGGIANSGSLTIVRSTIESNDTGFGAGIDDFGPSLSITNSTIMGNTAQTDGGGLYLAGTATLTNDTIANNAAEAGQVSGSGGGIFVSNSNTVDLTNTLLASNREFEGSSDCSGTVTSLGNNLADDSTCGLTASGDQVVSPASVGLGAVDDTNGPTDVLSLNSNSPAVDAGNDLACPATDQRDIARPQGPHCDIGAYEYTTEPSDYYVSTADEFNAALNSAGTFELPAKIHIAAGHYDLGILIGQVNFGSDPEGAEITLSGAGAASTILDGDHSPGDVFEVGGSATSTISGVTIENGSNDGIYDNGDVALDDSVVQNNGNYGVESTDVGLELSGSTISGNGVGIYTEANSFSAVNSTIADNEGDGLHVDSGNATLQNVTVAGNLGDGISGAQLAGLVNTIVANNHGANCDAAPTSNGHNLDSGQTCGLTGTGDLSGTDPQLGPLQDNGGPTPTMALPPGSPAVDAGDDSNCPAVDQRGITRPQGPHCDIGAFELQQGVGPVLTGSLSTSGQNDVNLTTLGSQDWAVWGYANNGTSTSLAPDVRKSGGSAISNLTDVDPTGVPLRGIGQFVGELPYSFNWSDGSGPASASGALAGLQNDGSGASGGAQATTTGDGFSFTVPADTTERTLTVFTSEHWGTGTLTATLSDGSAQPYSASVNSPFGDDNFAGNEPGVFTIRYEAASSGQHLTVSWVETGDNCATDGHCDNAAIYAVALSDELSNLTVNVTPSSAGAGIDQVPIASIPNAWLSFYAGSTNSTPVGSTPVGSTPVGSTPVGSTPVGSTPVGSTPVGSTPVGSTPVGSTPVGSTGLFNLPVGSTPVGSTALSSVLLSQIQLHGVTWSQILCGSLLTKPLTAVTLEDLKDNTEQCTDGKTSLQHFEALTLTQVDLTTTLLKSVHWATLLMGNTPLSSLPGGFSAWCGVGGQIPADGGSCTNATGATTVLQMDVAGQLGSAPVGSTPVGSTPVGSTPVGSTPVGSTDVPASLLANILLSDIANDDGDLAAVVNCAGSFSCTGKTLGDAYTANAILPTATFSDIANAMAADNITINDLVVAIIGAAGFPWEQLPIQGLQPYSATKSTVKYTISANVDCTIVSQVMFTAHLPRGFFPVDGSAQIAFGNNAPTSAGTPTVLGQDAASAQKLNSYRWNVACPAEGTANETATLTFNSWVGLDLGTFAMGASATTADSALSTTGAPVTVHQNAEASDPSTANQIQPNTLVVGHIPFSGEQAFYKVNIGALPQGTRLQAFLNVPSDADFDLTISAPAAPSFFSTPVGSTPVGSTPIEDNGAGFAGIGQALSPDTLEDVPVGSTPVGSTPVGSTPVGSTSDARGDGVNEAGGIITSGQSGYATIGVSGYNGATSNQPFVLRVQETPPPALPACPARTFPNGAPSSFAPGTLPSSLPTSTKTLFIVDKQRLTALYGATAVTNLLSSLNTLAARSEVSGTVLFVDGNAAVRSAYSAWDATPCNTTARNNVVTAINNVVATYRNSTAGLPNLHYIVLVGSDEATPMADVPDPVTLSPEENEAADLAFTTNGLTKANALYASAAQNNILTDGAYGAFTAIPWLGSNLLLPQISISRLVETPTDIIGQINRYLGNNGISAPQTAAGTLNPTSALVTGYDFLADGAKAVHDNLKANFPGLSTLDSFPSGNPAINFPGFPNPWTANDVVANALAAANPPSIISVDGHYNQYELESASGDLANSGQATSTNLVARILFTMGCHGGLNIPDTLGPPTAAPNKYLDWPELYAEKQAAMYIANTGYGYGDSDSVALSERLLALFAKNLHSDSGSVGEEWVDALQQYFATAGAYDVYDQKVMEETTFYGLPFWHFSTAGSSASFTPLTTTTDPLTGTQSATVTFPAAGDTTQSQFGLYRPILPITSQQVTSSLPARGVWIKSLTSNDTNTNATIGYPTIDSTAHEPAPSIAPIFFPASPFTLEHSLAFGTERDYLNVSDQFRPTGSGNAGVQRHFTGGQFEIFYSQSTNQVAPLISEVNVSTSGGVATITTRVTDNSSQVAEAAALVNDGTWHYLQLSQSAQDPTLWTGTISVAEDPEVFVEATDGVNVSYSANKGSNFTSTNSAPPAGPQILIASPVGPYGAHANVVASYTCPGAVSCVGTVPNGSPIDTSPGKHTFLVTATDAGGNVTTLQRTYSVGDLALTASVSPSSATAGTAVVAKASLTNTSSTTQSVTASATFAFGTKFVVNVPAVTFNLAAGKTIAVSLPFVVPKLLPKGTYAVTLRASDLAGPVTATATLTVS